MSTPDAVPGRETRPPRRRVHTRARLLESAERVIVEHGYAQTTIEDLCAAAGYTRGAFYSNFSGKDDLVLALFDRHSADRLDQLERLLDGSGAVSAEGVARALLEVDALERNWILLFLEFRIHAARDPRLGAKLDEHDRAVRDALAELLQRCCPGVARGVAPVGGVAATLLAIREGILARTAGEGPGAREALEAAVATLSAILPELGIAPAPAAPEPESAAPEPES
ncbi:TetR/AcrR family transcriptional regulator [Streptomyces sp. NPDC058086]|uniref:TetR/AcrR family transcriptional regulator n=1 Tax=Streptomyces sp. NPDC058086 TaxID=3346334 RepID=UPI0036E386F0